MAEFITDRAREHVNRLKRLRAKGWHNMSASERVEYTGYAAKGSYNYTDLNRVETAVNELAAELGLTLVTKTDWGLWDLPTVSDMERYLSNVAAIRDACPGDVAFPDLPSSMNRLSFDGANNIEKVLLLVYEELHGGVEPEEPEPEPDNPEIDDPEHRCILGEFVLGVCRLDGRAHTPENPETPETPDVPDNPDNPVDPGDADYIRSGEIYCGEVV